MSWAKLDDAIYDHPKILGTDLDALGLYLLALAYTARHLTDGHLTVPAVALLSRGNASLAPKLVASGLWDANTDGSYTIHDYLDWNVSANDVKLLRKAAKVRMRAYRLRSPEQNKNERGTNTFVPVGRGLRPSRPSRAVRQNLTPKKKKQQDPTALELSADATSKMPAIDFTAFWQAYPPRNGRRDRKGEAAEAWQKLAPDPALAAVILAAVRRYAAATELPVDAVRYLRHRRWEDEVEVKVTRRVPVLGAGEPVPDEKPTRTAEQVASVAAILDTLPFLRGHRG